MLNPPAGDRLPARPDPPRMTFALRNLAALVALGLALVPAAAADPAGLSAFPPAVTLRGREARGQNGFALSLLGYDHDFDYAAITEEDRGRRVFPAAPESSLLLRKPSGQVPHGGGKRLTADHPDFAKLLRWIAAGTPRTPADA